MSTCIVPLAGLGPDPCGCFCRLGLLLRVPAPTSCLGGDVRACSVLAPLQAGHCFALQLPRLQLLQEEGSSVVRGKKLLAWVLVLASPHSGCITLPFTFCPSVKYGLGLSGFQAVA